MSVQHHGHDDWKAAQRFIGEVAGVSRREFPNGRIGGEDDGETAIAVAADRVHNIIRVQFTHPMAWIGLDEQSARGLIQMLEEKLVELRCGNVTGSK